jgi:hypothetical protein
LIANVRHDDDVVIFEHEHEYVCCSALRTRAGVITSEKRLTVSGFPSGTVAPELRQYASCARMLPPRSRRGGLTLPIKHRPLVATNDDSLTAAEEAMQ